MTVFVPEPGTRVSGRYRLEDRFALAPGWAAWKAIDETLARPVTALTFAPGWPRIREVVTAALALSRLSERRLVQIFDVEGQWDHAYVIMEWVTGESLEDLLTAGPLDQRRSAILIAGAADALSRAHAAGLAHLNLMPEALRWSPASGIKVVGVGISAALGSTTADDPALADTQGLGNLLYTALTGYWPGPDHDRTVLPAAPTADGLPLRPRQVRADLAAQLDELTWQAMFQADRGGHRGNFGQLATPAQLAAALLAVTEQMGAPEIQDRAEDSRLRQSRQRMSQDDGWPDPPAVPKSGSPSRLLGGRYELDGIVGSGGMTQVYRARDLRLDRIVAVKTLRDDLARNQALQARFAVGPSPPRR